MNFADYQIAAARTLSRRPLAEYSKGEAEKKLAVMGLGLAGESGEVIEHIKKVVGHGHVIDRELVKKELGDVLWYVAAIATLLDLPLGDVAFANIEKLKARYPKGFSEADSINRSKEG